MDFHYWESLRRKVCKMPKRHAKRKNAPAPFSWLRMFIFIVLPVILLISIISGNIFMKAYHQHPEQFPRMKNIQLVLANWIAERKKHIAHMQEKKQANKIDGADNMTATNEKQNTTPEFKFYNTLPTTQYSTPPISAPVTSDHSNQQVVAQDELERAFSNELASEKLNVKRKRKFHD